MKKQIITWGLMFAATLALSVSCAKEQDMIAPGDESLEPVGVPFELFAGVDTKTTTNADASVFSWAEGDALNVFHAVAETTSYGKNDKFTFVSGSKFSGSLQEGELTADAYDWYVLYPYYSGIKSPANTSSGFTVFSNEQTQAAKDDMTHLAGLPLYGKATGVAKATKPSFTLKQAASIIRVNVTNTSQNVYSVSSVAVTAPQNIVGNYFINFTGETPSFTESTGYKTVTLNVTADAEIGTGATASFYVAVKPFTAAASSELIISVNGDEIPVTVNAATEFKPGKIKTIAVNYDPSQHATATYVFNTDAGLAALGITKPAAGKGTEIGGESYTVNDITVSFANGSASTNTRVWNSSGTLDLRAYSGSTITITPPAGFYVTKVKLTGSAYGPISSSPTGISSGTWTGSTNSLVLSATGSAKINTITVSCTKADTTPTIHGKTVSNLAARGAENQEVAIEFSNYADAPTIPTVTPDGTIITSASIKDITASGATLVYTIANNYTGAARDGSVTVVDSESHSAEFVFSQVADVFTVSRTSIELNANTGSTATFTVKSDFDWTIDDSTLNGFSVSPNSFIYTDSQSQTVTITATGQNATASPVDLDIFCVTRTADSKDSDAITVSQKSGKLSAPVLTITPDAANTKFTVSWTAVTNATKYEYYVLDGSAAYKVAVTQTDDASTKSFEVTGITLGEEYTVSVKAIGNSEPWVDSDESVEAVTVTNTAHYYVRVTALNQISSGSKIIIANSDHDGLGAFTTAGPHEATDLSAAYDSVNDRFDATDATVLGCVITLADPNTSGTNVYSLKQSNNYYIIKTSTSKTSFNPSTTKSTTDSGDWTLSLQTGNYIRVLNNTSGSTRGICWGTTQSKFGAYICGSDGYEDILMYVYQ